MPRRTDKRWKALPPDTFDGKEITFADTDQVDSHHEIAAEFMLGIFALHPGDYLITDEADILDFTPLDEPDTTAIWRRIAESYGLEQSAIGSGRLVRIFDAIGIRRRTQ